MFVSYKHSVIKGSFDKHKLEKGLVKYYECAHLRGEADNSISGQVFLIKSFTYKPTDPEYSGLK